MEIVSIEALQAEHLYIIHTQLVWLDIYISKMVLMWSIPLLECYHRKRRLQSLHYAPCFEGCSACRSGFNSVWLASLAFMADSYRLEWLLAVVSFSPTGVFIPLELLLSVKSVLAKCLCQTLTLGSRLPWIPSLMPLFSIPKDGIFSHVRI